MVDTMVDTGEFRSQGSRLSIRNTMVGQKMLPPIVRPKYTITILLVSINEYTHGIPTVLWLIQWLTLGSSAVKEAASQSEIQWLDKKCYPLSYDVSILLLYYS